MKCILMIAAIAMSTLSFAGDERSQPVSLISGFDDVLRQAHNDNLAGAALKLFEADKTFTGMPELYSELTAQESGEHSFTLISGIFSLFCHRIQKFLDLADYPKRELHLRNWLTEWSLENFKMTAIRKLVAQKSEARFLVIFDNSQASLNLADQLNQEMPEKIAAIYLRETVRRETIPGAEQFITAFDIANSERIAGRLTESQVAKIAERILNESDLEQIIPSYAYCPVDYQPCAQTGGSLSNLCLELEAKIQNFCRSRTETH